MTILGYQTSVERAVLWVDDLIYMPPFTKPADWRANKLYINPLACCAAASTGSYAVSIAAGSILTEARTLDRAAKRMPAALRSEFHETAKKRLKVMPAAYWRHSCYLVGYSHAMGRMVGVVFDSAYEFEPYMRGAEMVPDVGGDLDVSDEQAAIACAQMQVAYRRSCRSGDHGGVLTFAEITAAGIRCRPLWDLERGIALRMPRGEFG